MEIKKFYLPIATKKLIIDQIVENSLIERDGMKFIDYISMDLAIDLSLLQFYCEVGNIENIDMDQLYENGTIELIKSQIPSSELGFIEDNVLKMAKQEVEVYNSLSGVINRNLQEFINRLPSNKQITTWLNKLPKVLEKIDPNTMNIIKDIADGKLNQSQTNKKQRRKDK